MYMLYTLSYFFCVVDNSKEIRNEWFAGQLLTELFFSFSDSNKVDVSPNKEDRN